MSVNVVDATQPTRPYWTEIARHPQGFVLFARQGRRPSEVALKLMCPIALARWRGKSRRVFLVWDADTHWLSPHSVRDPSLADRLPQIYDWVLTILAATKQESRHVSQD